MTEGVSDGLVQKKGRSAGAEVEKQNSRVFEHYRSIGLITDDVPFAVQSRGGACFLTTSIGKTFHIYDVDTLGLLFVGPDFGQKIVALAAHDDDTFVALEDSTVVRLQRAVIKEKLFHPTADRILSMEVLGENLLVLRGRSLAVVTLDLKKTLRVLEFEGEATAMLHPQTYLNKMLIGMTNGQMELWNFSSGKMIHRFSHGSSQITSMAQAPVVDVAAIGYSDGTVSLLDLRQDKHLFSIRVKTAVTSISFRTDAAAQSKPQMAVGSADGLVSIWGLEGRNMELLIDAHLLDVTAVFFLPGQPILVTAGRDNAVKEWVFEVEEYRLLRSRSGHISPPTLVRFFGADGFSVLSTGGQGDQSLRLNSLLKDAQTHEISQGSIESKAKKLQVKANSLKLPPITCLDFFTAKDLKWDNLLSGHAGSSTARTWRIDNKTIGKHEVKAGATVTAVAVSPCGNFGLVGNSEGRVQLFNMQSGQNRRSFTLPQDSAIVGLAIDQFNRELLTVTATGLIVVFDVQKPSKILHTQQLPTGIVHAFAFKPDNGLAAIGLGSTIEVFDLEGRRVVRRLAGHVGSLLDMSFSADGKWLVSCAEDGTIRTWDLPTGLLIDCFTCHGNGKPTSIAFSPTGDFLVSTHQADLAIHLWANKTILSPLRIQHHYQHQMLTSSERCDNIQHDVISLSSQPRSKWISLFHLEGIKARNRPALPEKAPEKAPFFLDALIQAEPVKSKRTAEGEEKQVGEPARLEDYELILEKHLAAGDHQNTLSFLLAAGASQVHFELASLPSPSLPALLAFLLAQLRSRANYELIQTYLAITLKLHADAISAQPDLKPLVAELEAEQSALWGSLESLLQQALCLTTFCRDRY